MGASVQWLLRDSMKLLCNGGRGALDARLTVLPFHLLHDLPHGLGVGGDAQALLGGGEGLDCGWLPNSCDFGEAGGNRRGEVQTHFYRRFGFLYLI